jgi:hypothetical protein
MGRAYRVVKRTAHLTVSVAERPEKAGAQAAAPKRAKAADGGTPAKPAARARKATTSGPKAGAQE